MNYKASRDEPDYTYYFPSSRGEGIEDVSDIDKVKRIADELLSTKYYDGGEVPLALSTRKGKKFMIKSPEGKWIHFGDINLEDYTKHQDEDRLERFLTRNRRFKDAPVFTPAWMAYHILWGRGIGSSSNKVAPMTPDDITRAVFGDKNIVLKPTPRPSLSNRKSIERAKTEQVFRRIDTRYENAAKYY
jgi:hypothetical protein